MKTITYIFSSLAILLLGFTSCSNENEVINRGASQCTNNGSKVTFTLNTGVSTTRSGEGVAEANGEEDQTLVKKVFTTEALAREKAISSLYAVVFNKEGETFCKAVKIDLGSKPYELNMTSSGEFELLLIANPDNDLVKILTKKTSEFTFTDFASVLATQEAGENGGEGTGITNFLMTSEVNKDVSVAANSTLDLGTIELTRLAARFDFYNQVKGFEMTSILFTNRPAKSYLTEPMNQEKSLFSSDKEYTSFNGLNSLTSIGAIYSYEDITPYDCTFTLNGIYNGESITEVIKVGDKGIQRNHLYNIIITENKSPVTPDPNGKDDKLDYEVRVADWNTGEEIHFSGENLVNQGAPTFVASGIGVVTTPATESFPASVTAPKVATTVTIIATSASSADSQLFCVGEMPSGWKILAQKAGDISSKDGKLVHKFTLEMTENTTGYTRFATFKICNVFNPSACVRFSMTQSIDSGSSGTIEPLPKE